MSRRVLVVSGTDTGVGKTVFAAALSSALGADYWKPVQSGLEEETDSETVLRLGEVARERILPERSLLRTPVSPHLAAEIDGVEIGPDALFPPLGPRPLVVEGAGGLLVPLDRRTLTIDVFARWAAPVILCARTALGGINHALLSLEALAARGIPVLGVAFVGEAAPDTERTVAEFGRVKVLGRLPFLDPLTPSVLREAFSANFQLRDFQP
ncbi:MAG: dethiobiotin synthase [Proteobacteria bacterium]|nr:dethiobiotin synthase [Pseudomonadota bacterium]MBW3618366.1 dethiobiotin synthase [Pseudomonadota bacterium]